MKKGLLLAWLPLLAVMSCSGTKAETSYIGIVSADYVTWLREKLDAYACEMEGAAIARVCATFQKPFVVLRTLSDMADGSAHERYQNFADLAADQSSAIVIQMVESM